MPLWEASEDWLHFSHYKKLHDLLKNCKFDWTWEASSQQAQNCFYSPFPRPSSRKSKFLHWSNTWQGDGTQFDMFSYWRAKYIKFQLKRKKISNCWVHPTVGVSSAFDHLTLSRQLTVHGTNVVTMYIT